MIKGGFTLLELIVVIIILAILATLGYTQYAKMVEKGRTSEAKAILGQIRSAEMGYHQQFGGFTSTLLNLGVGVPTSCTSTHFFRYTAATTPAGGYATADRCTAGGKPPDAGAYSIILTFNASYFTGTAGYY